MGAEQKQKAGFVDSEAFGANKVEGGDSKKGIMGLNSLPFSPRKRKGLKVCCTCFIVTVLILVILIVTLSQTIFKFRDPEITLSSIKFVGIKIDFTKPFNPAAVNASLSANMNVRNPNRYNFKFSNSTIHVIYHEVMVGNISLPAGEIRARRAVDLPALVTAGSLHLGAAVGNLSTDLIKDILPFSMSAMIPGRVNVVNLFKHHVRLEYHCDVSFWIGNSTVRDYLCWKKVHMWATNVCSLYSLISQLQTRSHPYSQGFKKFPIPILLHQILYVVHHICSNSINSINSSFLSQSPWWSNYSEAFR